MGRKPAAATSAVQPASPVRSATRSPTATVSIHVPTFEISPADHTSAKLRCFSGAKATQRPRVPAGAPAVGSSSAVVTSGRLPELVLGIPVDAVVVGVVDERRRAASCSRSRCPTTAVRPSARGCPRAARRGRRATPRTPSGPVISWRSWPSSATAALRPTIAMIPLSWYSNGLVSLAARCWPGCCLPPRSRPAGPTEPSWGSDLPSLVGDVGGIAEHVDVGVAGHAEVRLDVDPPAAALREPEAPIRRPPAAAGPDHRVGEDLAAVGQHHLSGWTSATPVPKRNSTPSFSSVSVGEALRLVARSR